ncbi:MAG TPA: glycosyltransferase family 2 protein [Actinomycetota bacterium]|nr:glycosyltransferase family 2 protein [Actinomycetota bacterium]
MHLPLDPDVEGFANGKVAGVTTGVRAAPTERVIVADDDVRYSASSLAAVSRALDDADLVIPQNVFPSASRQPWHARWDGARSLLNRATDFDPPGTLAVRRSAFLAAGGYDGEVLFENLELIRTIAASGGRVAVRRDLAVERQAPTTRRFVEQRVRQAYDEFARPARLVAFLSIVPATVWLTRRRPWAPVALAAASIAVAEAGRRRDGGAAMFPAATPLFAPLWVAERAVCSWLALGNRVLRGGVPYRGRVLTRSATSMRRLRSRRETVPLRATRHTTAWSASDRTGTAARSRAGS